MSRLDNSHKGSRFCAISVFVCFFVLVIGNQPLALSKAASDYEEDISLSISMDIDSRLPAFGNVAVYIDLRSVTGASDYTSVSADEPIIKNILVSWEFRLNNNNLGFAVVFDSSRLDSVEEGRLIAETIVERIEGVWGIDSSYTGYYIMVSQSQGESVNETNYNYIAEEHSLQKLKDVLLHYCPSEGFGEILHSMSFWDYVDVHLNLMVDDRGNPVWNIYVWLRYDKYLYVYLNQEYTVSLKNLIGYAGSIQSMPGSSNSYLTLSVPLVEPYNLKVLRHVPEQMSAGWDFNYFTKYLNGENVDDLSLSFSYVPANASPTTDSMILFATFVAIIIISSFLIMRIKPRRIRTIS